MSGTAMSILALIVMSSTFAAAERVAAEVPASQVASLRTTADKPGF